MLKVLIADDEKNICLMIQKLVPWENYGMKVIDIVQNGIDAMRAIETWKPDVVISDIRMPGYDGLEIIQRARELNLDTDFIIISGYKYFEYAHKALKLGVEYYLLKPIDKKELWDDLEKIAEKRKSVMATAQEREKLKAEVSSSRKKMHKHFLSNIIRKNVRGQDLEMSRVNAEYQLSFEQGRFTAVFIKIDCEEIGQDLTSLLNMAEDVVDKMLQEVDLEYITSIMKSGVIVLINEREEMTETARNTMMLATQRIKWELDKFKGYHMTVGIGGSKMSISGITDSIDEAVKAIKCRGKVGLDKKIFYEQLKVRELPLQTILGEKQIHEIENIVDSLDYETFHKTLTKMHEDVQADVMNSPVVIYDYLEHVAQIILRVLRRNQMEEKILTDLETDLNQILDFYAQTSDMVYYYSMRVRKCFEEIIASRKNRSLLPIRMAKQYVQENYSRQVSLEDVAEAINMSPAYLSTMFKKEMGINFSDFLISCRMDAAKNILRTTDLPINEVAEKVGYTDARYFSKTFSKMVGLKPSAYRKLYL